MTVRQTSDGAWYDAAGTRRFTGYVIGKGGEDEEIDVNARDKNHATRIIMQVLVDQYEPGMTIKEVREQNGLYI